MSLIPPSIVWPPSTLLEQPGRAQQRHSRRAVACVQMIVATAFQRAGAARRALNASEKLQPAIRRGRDVIHIEIDQPRIGRNAVRVVAGRACGCLLRDVKPMSAVRAGTALPWRESFGRSNAFTAVAFVAQCVVRRVLRAEICQEQLPFEQRRVT